MTDAQRQRIRAIILAAVDQVLDVLQDKPEPRKRPRRTRRHRAQNNVVPLDQEAVERLARQKGVTLSS